MKLWEQLIYLGDWFMSNHVTMAFFTMGNDFYHGVCNHTYNMAVQRYRKILKISPHMYKPPKPVRQKTLL